MQHTLGGAARRPLQAVPLTLRRQAAALAAGFLTGGWGGLYGLLYPFGLGLALGAAEQLYLSVGVGAVLGVLVRADGPQVVSMLSALAGCTAARWLYPRRFGPACAAGCGVLAGTMLLMQISGAATFAQLRCAMVESLLAALLGWSLRRWPVSEGGAGLLLAGTAGVAAAANLPLATFETGIVPAALAVLILACRGRLRDAAVAAILLSAALAAARPELVFAAVSLCGGAVAAAVFAPGEKLRCAAVFWLGCLGRSAPPKPATPSAFWGRCWRRWRCSPCYR